MIWKSEKQLQSELTEKIKELERKKSDILKWWNTLDMNCPYLCKLYSKMYGSDEQRIEQLYIIRNNQKFTLNNE